MSGEQLERRYRGLLRLLPKPYREARGEELLSVLMEGSAEGRQWPEPREVFSLAWLGLRVRAEGAGAGAGAQGVALERKQLGEMSRLVAVLGSVLLAYVGVIQLALIVRNLRTFPGGYPLWQILNPFAAGADSPVKQRLGVSVLLVEAPPCWLIVVALLALGWWRAARGLAGVIFVPSYLVNNPQEALRRETVLAGVVIAALFLARGPAARPVRVPGFAAVAALIGVMAFAYRDGEGPLVRGLWVLQGYGYSDNGHVMAAAAILVAAVCVAAYRSVVWPVAIAVVAVAADVPVVADGLFAVQVSRPGAAPMVYTACALVAVAGVAVLRYRRSQRSAAGADGGSGEMPAG